jgi:preprotein translocase subunit SecG
MGVLSVILLALFIIAAILLILLVLVQNEEGDSLGGIFAGGSASAFGSRSGNVLTKATSILGAVFLTLSLGLALINKSPAGAGVEAAGRELTVDVESDWWQEQDAGTRREDQTLESPVPDTTGEDRSPETPVPETQIPETPTTETTGEESTPAD